MKYYGYRGGAQPTTYFITNGLDDVKSLLKGATIEANFDTYVGAAIDSFKSYLQNNPDMFPPQKTPPRPKNF